MFVNGSDGEGVCADVLDFKAITNVYTEGDWARPLHGAYDEHESLNIEQLIDNFSEGLSLSCEKMGHADLSSVYLPIKFPAIWPFVEPWKEYFLHFENFVTVIPTTPGRPIRCFYRLHYRLRTGKSLVV